MASAEVQNVAKFAICSRLFVICLQVVSNALIPDHDAKVFNPPQTESNSFTGLDKIILFTLGGLRRWDAVYFLHIAQHGYTYENCVAFFPFYPLISSLVTRLFSACPFVSETSVLLISAVLVNLIVFVAAALLLLRLGQAVTQDNQLAYYAAVLFCVNPASIFMTAPYTETLFAALSFAAMLCVKKQRLLGASVFIGASALTRSNGLVSLGFILHSLAVEYCTTLAAAYRVFYNRHLIKFMVRLVYETVMKAVSAFCFVILSTVPFLCFQFYIYELFCFPFGHADKKLSLDPSVIDYGRREGYKLLGDGPVSPWCNSRVPLSYSYIQRHHWGVGFLSYYQLKQIPNFILAAPMVVLSLSACRSVFRQQPRACRLLGLLREEKVKVETVGAQATETVGCGAWQNAGLVVYMLHLLFLTCFGCLFMHIQVVTRFLCSASPLVYWYAAHLVFNYSTHDSSQVSLSRLMEVYTLTAPRGKYVLLFFLGYFVIGTITFSNFLPWT